MKSDLNKENDAAYRAGVSAVYGQNKKNKSKQNALKDEEVKQQTLDFIFGKSEINPLKDIK